MRNLIILIIKNHAFFIFIILESFCVFLINSNKPYQKAIFINTFDNAVGNIYEAKGDVTQYFGLKSVNDSLIIENARLREQLLSSGKLDTSFTQEVIDSVFNQKYEYIPAKVLNNTVHLYNNYMIIDKGQQHGIQPGMAVIGPSGIAGVVKNASNRHAVVLSLLNKKFRVRGRISHSGQVGAVVWDDTDPLEADLQDIGKYVIVNQGDTVVTSGYSMIFPENIMIGTISEIMENPGNDYYSIKIRLTTNFNSLQYVYVVKNLFKDELQSIKDMIDE